MAVDIQQPDSHSPTPKIGLAGLVLCGGESTRMGQPKAWLEFGNETLLQRIVRLVSTVASNIVVVAAQNQSLPNLPAEVQIVHDPIANEGPLVGLQAGLQAIRPRAEIAFVCACDMPFINPEAIKFLAARLGDGPALIINHAGRCEPLASLYRTSLADDFAKAIQRGERSLYRAIEQIGLPQINSDELRAIDPHLQFLRNVNTQDEYQNALQQGI